jgi:hypothetical protein
MVLADGRITSFGCSGGGGLVRVSVKGFDSARDDKVPHGPRVWTRIAEEPNLLHLVLYAAPGHFVCGVAGGPTSADTSAPASASSSSSCFSFCAASVTASPGHGEIPCQNSQHILLPTHRFTKPSGDMPA